MNRQSVFPDRFILISVAIFIFFSCTNEPQGLEGLDPVCFETQILPLIQSSCATSGCHDAETKKEGYNFTSYESILAVVDPGNAGQSKLYQVITDIHKDLMPPHQPLSIDDRNLIKIWIEQGAENTKCSDITGIPGPIGNNKDTVCFNLDILPILSSTCATSGCHDAATAEEGYVLTSYANIYKLIKPGNFADSKLYKVLTDNGDDRMPPAPAGPLSQEQINKIRKWITDGGPNSNCTVVFCDTAGTVSFSSHIWPVIENNCVGCHPASGSSNSINLGNYSQVKAVASITRSGTSLLYGVVHQSAGFVAMPQNGRLDNCSLALVDKWITQGMANN